MKRQNNYERKMKKGKELIELTNQQKSAIAQQHIQQVEQAHAAAMAVEYHFDIEQVGTSFKRIQKSEKLKRDLEKQRIEQAKAKRDEKRAAADLVQHEIKMRQKEKTSYLKSKDKQKGQLITEIKEALREDIDQKKEISLLKKKD